VVRQLLVSRRDATAPDLSCLCLGPQQWLAELGGFTAKPSGGPATRQQRTRSETMNRYVLSAQTILLITVGSITHANAQANYLKQFTYASNTKGTAGLWADRSQAVKGDFNGDGLTDLAYVYADTNGDINIDVYVDNGSQFIQQRWSTDHGGWIDQMRFVAGDFNGDGRTDIASFFNDGNGDINIDVFRSTGTAFVGPERWANAQGGIVDPADLLAGDFDGDGYADIAYVFSLTGQIDIDVHRSTGSQANGGFQVRRWVTGQGGWIDITTHDPGGSIFSGLDGARGMCTNCERFGQWIVGDFNGDRRADLALAYKNGSGDINLDVHMSTYAPSMGNTFAFLHTPTPGGWIPVGWWVAQDMNLDGVDDLVYTFQSYTDLSVLGVDVHVSNLARDGSWSGSEAFSQSRWYSAPYDTVYFFDQTGGYCTENSGQPTRGGIFAGVYGWERRARFGQSGGFTIPLVGLAYLGESYGAQSPLYCDPNLNGINIEVLRTGF
jgi:hypothetical protein